MRRLIALCFVVCAFVAGPAAAAVKPNPLISDGMVLQRGQVVPLWGTASPGEKIVVSFQGHETETTAQDGAWTVWLNDLESGGPFEMTIHGHNEVRIKDVYVGEVWLCAGQMNMDWPLHFDAHGEDVLPKCQDAQLHFFQVRYADASAPQKSVRGAWKACTPESAADFSAVAYYFGRDLRKRLGVPVGLIQATEATGTADEWIPRAALESDPKSKEVLQKYDEEEKEYASRVDRYLKEYEEQVRNAVRDGKDAPPSHPPQNPFREWDRPAGLYNGMIAPLQPYGIRGVAWYQGESDVSRPAPYEALLTEVVDSWRAAWKQPDMPFLIVQLAPAGRALFGGPPRNSGWAQVRDAERQVSKKVPQTALVTTEGEGKPDTIQPSDKGRVGQHLALAARAVAYGEKVAYTGPVYDSFKYDQHGLIIRFIGASNGLASDSNREVSGFAIAGKDQHFVRARAVIRDDAVVVGGVDHPVAVRYGWDDFPIGDLKDGAGLYASPFRTDDFPLPDKPPKDDASATQSLAHEVPDGAIKIDLPPVQQRDDYSCGAAALMSVCSYYHVGPEELEDYKKELGTNEENGTNVYAIARMARDLGLQADIRHGMTLDELRKLLDAGTPVIVSIQAYGDPTTYYRDDNGHYVTAIGYDETNFYFEDPVLPGRRGFLSVKDFDKRWHDDEGTTEHPDVHAHLGVVIGRKQGAPARPPQARKID